MSQLKPKAMNSPYRGELYSQTLDLSKKDFSSKLTFKAIGFSKAAVTIKCIGATGTSGNASIQQGNEEGSSQPLPTPVNIALGISTSNSNFEIEFNGAYLTIDLPSSTLGTVGKIIVIVNLK